MTELLELAVMKLCAIGLVCRMPLSLPKCKMHQPHCFHAVAVESMPPWGEKKALGINIFCMVSHSTTAKKALHVLQISLLFH